MKIVHVVQNYYPSMGGTQTLFKEVSERLVKMYGDEVIVCTTNSYYGPEKKVFKKITSAEEEINGVKVKRFKFFRLHHPVIRIYLKVMAKLGLEPGWLLTGYLNGPWSPSLKKYLLQTDAAVICGSSANYLYMQYPLMKKANKPFVFMGALHFNEDENYLPVPGKVVEAIKYSKFFIANTHFEKQRLIKFGVNDGVIKVAGCGVDISSFKAATSRKDFLAKYNVKDGPIVAFIGRHEPAKGIDVLIDAMELLWKKGRQYNLIIAGSATTYTSKLKERISLIDEGYSSNITFISNFTNREKVEIFNHLDLFVSVSTAESFGIVYLEAWACKKPVIGADIGSVRSVIQNNVDGYLINPGKAKDLAEKIDYLCRDEDKRKAFGESGYNKTVENFTWDIITAKYRQIYVDAVNN